MLFEKVVNTRLNHPAVLQIAVAIEQAFGEKEGAGTVPTGDLKKCGQNVWHFYPNTADDKSEQSFHQLDVSYINMCSYIK